MLQKFAKYIVYDLLNLPREYICSTISIFTTSFVRGYFSPEHTGKTQSYKK